MVKKKYLILGLACTVCFIAYFFVLKSNASTNLDNKNTHIPCDFGTKPCLIQNTPVTTQTLLHLVPEAPENVSKQVREWFINNHNIASYMFGYKKLIGSTEPIARKVTAMLKKTGAQVFDFIPEDYVFSIPQLPEYVIKVSGHFNRKENLNWLASELGQEYTWGRPLTQQDYQAFERGLDAQEFDSVMYRNKNKIKKNSPKTYQTISWMARYLLAREVIQKHGFNDIILPQVYLVSVPGKPQEISDRNYVVVEKKIEGLKTIEYLTYEQAEKVKTIIKETGLFVCNKDTLKVTQDGKLVFLNLESPNYESPRYFFHNTEWVFNNNVRAGLEDFKKNFAVKD
jgi:hypothetical protein